MGIPGLIQELGPGDRVSLAKIAIDHLTQTSQQIRIAIDISIWLFQSQAAQGGGNPELRTLFYRLVRLLALPIRPLFVFDGPGRPEYKRGKRVQTNYAAEYLGITEASKRLIELLGFQYYDAPGEAEAQCSKFQMAGVVDAVMSDDIDTLMFGSGLTLMNYSKASKSAAATHVNVYRQHGTASNIPFDSDGMVLFALLSGGDYLPKGVPKCGPKLAAEIVRAGFGADLIDIIKKKRKVNSKLQEWRERLEYELSTNESGYFRSKHGTVKIPSTFPDMQALNDYINPLTVSSKELENLRNLSWPMNVDTAGLRQFVVQHFRWTQVSDLTKKLAPSLLCRSLHLASPDSSQIKICGRKQNAHMDGLFELKLQFVPELITGLEPDLFPDPASQAQDTYPSEDINNQESDQDESIDPAAQPAYDPKMSDTVWAFESLVSWGMPDAVKAWEEAQQKKLTKQLSPKKPSRKTKKVIDSGMAPNALHRYGTIVKSVQPKDAAKSTPKIDSKGAVKSGRTRNGASAIQKTIADCSEFAVRSTKSGVSLEKPPGPTSSDVDAAMNLEFSDEGRLKCPLSQQSNIDKSTSSRFVEPVNVDVNNSETSSDLTKTPVRRRTRRAKESTSPQKPFTTRDNKASAKSLLIETDSLVNSANVAPLETEIGTCSRPDSPSGISDGVLHEEPSFCSAQVSPKSRKKVDTTSKEPAILFEDIDLAEVTIYHGYWSFKPAKSTEDRSIKTEPCRPSPRKSRIKKSMPEPEVVDLT